MKKFYWLLALPLLVVWFFPGPDEPDYLAQLPHVPFEPNKLELYVAENESHHHLKPGTAAEIVWANKEQLKTEFALVYLHGFSASHHEGFPLHRNLAQSFSCNLYLARLHQHGIDTSEALLDFSAEGFYNSAKEALAIGGRLGHKVILIGTSTGGTAALKLAADFPESVHAVINLSPNVRINDPFAFLLNDPFGLPIAKVAMGGSYRIIDGGEEYARYWHDKYRVEALVQLQELIETTMISETFREVRQPVFNGYYYQSEENQDKVVRVDAILWMHDLLATPDSLKRKQSFPMAGDHVLASPIKSEDPDGVETAVKSFMQEILKMKPVSSGN